MTLMNMDKWKKNPNYQGLSSKPDQMPAPYAGITEISAALRLEGASEWPGGRIELLEAGPTLEFLVQCFWGGVQEFACLTSPRWCWCGWFRNHTLRPTWDPLWDTNVFHAPYFTSSKIALGIQMFAVSLTGLVMGMAAECYLVSMRWLRTANSDRVARWQNIGGRTILLEPDWMWGETLPARMQDILQRKKVKVLEFSRSWPHATNTSYEWIWFLLFHLLSLKILSTVDLMGQVIYSFTDENTVGI